MYAPRGWALKKRPLFVLGKVFRAALSLIGLFGLLRSCPQSARTGAQRMGGIGRLQTGSNHTFGNRKSLVGIGLVVTNESDSGSSRRAAIPPNEGYWKSIPESANHRPSPRVQAGGVGRGRGATFLARSRFRCDCFVLGLVVCFIATLLLVRLVLFLEGGAF